MLALLLGCSACNDGPASSGVDPCCSPAGPGEEVWDTCHDTTVKAVTCQQAATCCEVAWGDECAAFYQEFSPTCGALAAGGPSNDGPLPGADLDRTTVKVSVTMDPVPNAAGGNLFWEAFEHEDPFQAPPVDFGQLSLWTNSFPVETEADLAPGLWFWAVYGLGEYPQPGDRRSAVVQLQEGASTIELVIGAERMPAAPME